MLDAVGNSRIFAANRAVGRVALAVSASGRVSRRSEVHEEGSLRVRFPAGANDSLEAVLVNTAGGIAGGDRFAVDVTVGEGARLAVATAAAEKVYRALDEAASIDLRLSVGSGGHLAWLPQETILFDRARLRRTIEADLAADARIVIAEALVFGRTAMGEAVAQGSLFDRWRVRRDGRLIFAETVRLDGAIAETLAGRAVAAGGASIATVLIVPGNEAHVAAVRAVAEVSRCEIGASAWNGLAAVRCVAEDGAALRRQLMAVLASLNVPLPRLWLQ